ncbi:MAG: pantoate--beta-alanine ligase [Flavobacteriales bacterium]
MQTFVTREEINNWRSQQQANHIKVGFVPTMGALHEGHLSLVKQAVAENEVVVVSIFVNPKQFNQPADLQAYPRMLSTDIQYLEGLGSIVVFAPNEQEMYPANLAFTPMPLGKIGTLLEGAHRPGHFEGVVHVVHHLFELIKPHKAYFGQKDFQQLAIIRQLNAYYGFGIDIVGCQTIREKDGLAMSSRNLRLSAEERQQALSISKALRFVQQQVGIVPIQETIRAASAIIENANLRLEYLAIVDPLTLENCEAWQEKQVCCVAAFCGEVRLIDNMLYESVL